MTALSGRLEACLQSASRARGGKIFLDYLRNSRGATFVAPYSTRAKPGAPVSMPLHWDQVSPDIRPETFTVRTVVERLGAPSSDPFAEFETLAQRIPPGFPSKHE